MQMDLMKYKNRKVVLVDEQDNELGVASLVEAHRGLGQKHRAFSLILHRRKNGKLEVLLQRRAEAKPVFAHKWANTCCYNMAPGEEYLARATSRVKEELGIDLPAGRQGLGDAVLKKLYQFSYYAPDPEKPGWCENELDQIIVGEMGDNSASPVQIKPNPEEVEDYRWVEWEQLKSELEEKPEEFGPWWKEIVSDGRLEQYLFSE